MRIVDIVAAIENDGCTRTLMDRLRELEAKQDELTERLSNTLADIPDIHPNVAGIYRRKVERLAEALGKPQERDKAARAIRGLIERIVLASGPKCPISMPRCTAISTLSSNRPPIPARGTGPARRRPDCRSRWLRGLATTETDIL